MYPRFKGTKIFGLLSFRPKILLDLSSFYLKCFTNNFFLTQFLFNKKFVVPKTYWSHLFFIYRASPKKKGISECYSLCCTAHLIWNLEYLFLIQWIIEIHMFVANTKPFMSNIREPRNISSLLGFVCSKH